MGFPSMEREETHFIRAVPESELSTPEDYLKSLEENAAADLANTDSSSGDDDEEDDLEAQSPTNEGTPLLSWEFFSIRLYFFVICLSQPGGFASHTRKNSLDSDLFYLRLTKWTRSKNLQMILGRFFSLVLVKLAASSYHWFDNV